MGKRKKAQTDERWKEVKEEGKRRDCTEVKTGGKPNDRFTCCLRD